MNPVTLSPFPSQSAEQARHWLASVHRQLSSHPKMAWEVAVNDLPPAAVPAFTDWVDRHGLRQAQGEGWVLSMTGVAFLLSRDDERLSPSQAWKVAEQLLAKVKWVNEAAVELFPMRVADVLLFGSMANPSAVDHGDLDALLVLEPKQENAHRLHETFLQEHGLVEPGHWYSFRQTLEELFRKTEPFASLTVTPRPLQVLLDQDMGFSAFSLLGKTWDEAMLGATTVDEDAFAVFKALENGADHPAWRAHIKRQLRAMADFDATWKEQAMAGVEGHPGLTQQQQVWWSSGHLPVSASPDLCKAAGLFWGNSSHPLARQLEQGWQRVSHHHLLPAPALHP